MGACRNSEANGYWAYFLTGGKKRAGRGRKIKIGTNRPQAEFYASCQ